MPRWENVIVGRIVPASTGGRLARLKQIADKRDKLILEKQARSSRELLPAVSELEEPRQTTSHRRHAGGVRADSPTPVRAFAKVATGGLPVVRDRNWQLADQHADSELVARALSRPLGTFSHAKWRGRRGKLAVPKTDRSGLPFFASSRVARDGTAVKAERFACGLKKRASLDRRPVPRKRWVMQRKGRYGRGRPAATASGSSLFDKMRFFLPTPSRRTPRAEPVTL